jgi:hypothetical protein
MKELLPIRVQGHVTITDTATGEVLVDRHNDIHPKNMAIAIARGLANSPNFQIFKMKLGNGGTFINSEQKIVFRPANVVADDADLYNATYVEVVDDGSVGVGPGNSVTYTQIPATTNTRVIVTCIISPNEAVNRVSDGSAGTDPLPLPDVGELDPEGQFFFDELGLFTKQTSGTDTDLDPAGELMLSHLIFSPIEKTSNRELTIVYSVTISVS